MFIVTEFLAVDLKTNNSSLISSQFKICERYCRGDSIWCWIKRIVALKAKKIVWDVNADHPNNLEIYAVSMDGTDF
jgi:hypothetical protein